MIKRILGESDFSAYATIALLLFVGVFVVVSIVTLFRSKSETRRQARVIFDENEETE